MTGSGAPLFTLASVTIISAVPLAALLALSGTPALRRAIPHLVGMAAGALLGSALLELVPESLKRLGFSVTAPALALAGFLVFFLAEGTLSRSDHTSAPRSVQPVVMLNFAGVLAHNAIDGMVVAASFLVSVPLGLSTAVAIFLHEIPHELGDFGVFVQGGLSVRRAAWLNFASAGGAYAGAVVMLLVGSRATSLASYVIPFAAGNFIFIAASMLIPELRRTRRASAGMAQFVMVLVGVLLVALPMLLGSET